MFASNPTNAFKTNGSRATNPTALSGITGGVGQATLTIIMILAIYLTFMFIEIMYKYYKRLTADRAELLPNTYSMESRSVTIPQNPMIPTAKPISMSRNERSGVEFTYSFYLNIHPSTFRQESGLMHIFHKGYSSQFPLLAPGVYMHSETNTLRVYMNTYKTWNNFVEVDNFPVGKWVHVAILCKEKALEVHINGNLSRKMSYDGFAPYQNYQDVVCFSQRRIHMLPSSVPSLTEILDVFGAAKGMISRLTYFSYALCYAEIQTMMNEGPSTKMDDDILKDIPPYLSDTWWHSATRASSS